MKQKKKLNDYELKEALFTAGEAAIGFIACGSSAYGTIKLLSNAGKIVRTAASFGTGMCAGIPWFCMAANHAENATNSYHNRSREDEVYEDDFDDFFDDEIEEDKQQVVEGSPETATV